VPPDAARSVDRQADTGGRAAAELEHQLPEPPRGGHQQRRHRLGAVALRTRDYPLLHFRGHREFLSQTLMPRLAGSAPIIVRGGCAAVSGPRQRVTDETALLHHARSRVLRHAPKRPGFHL
jgi:hypothetical protein